MTDLRKAAEMALETLCVGANDAVPNDIDERFEQAIQALRQALAQDWLQELAEIDHSLGLFVDAPPKQEWVGLTDAEIDDLWKTEYFNIHYELPKAIESKLKEKN